MNAELTCLSRRRWLAGLATCGAWTLQPTALAHQSLGPVNPPQLVPDLTLTGGDARALSLKHALLGQVTALQLMFTGCSATCPIQGAVFGSVQQRLKGADVGLRLVSVSIDPLGDDPQALRAWLRRFEADPRRWPAGVVRHADVDRFQDFTPGRAGGGDRHTPQVYIFNRRAELMFRTLDLRSAEQIVDVMRQVSRFVLARRRSGPPNARMSTSPRSRAPNTWPCIGKRTAQPDPQGPALTMWRHDFTRYPSQNDRSGTGLVCRPPPLRARICFHHFVRAS